MFTSKHFFDRQQVRGICGLTYTKAVSELLMSSSMRLWTTLWSNITSTVRVTQTQTKAHTAELQGSSYAYLLIFLGAIGEEDALLHVAVQNLLYCRHVTFNDILHLNRQTVKTQRIREMAVSLHAHGCERRTISQSQSGQHNNRAERNKKRVPCEGKKATLCANLASLRVRGKTL